MRANTKQVHAIIQKAAKQLNVYVAHTLTKRSNNMPGLEIFGGIVDLATNTEYVWDGVTLDAALADLRKLSGTKYGVHWEYAGDCGLKEGNICVAYKGAPFNNDAIYSGKTAVANFLAAC